MSASKDLPFNLHVINVSSYLFSSCNIITRDFQNLVELIKIAIYGRAHSSFPNWTEWFKAVCVKFYDLAGMTTKFDVVICKIFDIVVLALFCSCPCKNICTCQNITSVTITGSLYRTEGPFYIFFVCRSILNLKYKRDAILSNLTHKLVRGFFCPFLVCNLTLSLFIHKKRCCQIFPIRSVEFRFGWL